MKGRTKIWAVAVVATLVFAAAIGIALVGQAAAVSTPVVIGGARPDVPAISGSQVVWADKRAGNWDLFLYDGATRRTTQLTTDAADQAMPSVSGGTLAYVDFSTGQGDVVLRELASGTETRLAIDGPQMYPSLSGDWLTYEDRAMPGTSVVVRNRAGTVELSYGGSNASATHPKVAGNLLVFEDRSASTSGGDADIKAVDLVTGSELMIASSPAQELFPATDGRYIAWAQGTEQGSFEIRCYDRQSGRYSDLTSDAGEHTLPAVADGHVYWIHNTPGTPLHVDTCDMATGETSPYYTYSTGDVTGLQASGHNTAWLENVGNRRRVRAVFSDSLVSMAKLTGFSPLGAAASSFRLATVFSGTDAIPPTITSTSVKPGQTEVSSAAAFTVQFSEQLDPSTVNADTVKLLSGSDGSPVAASVSYSMLAKTVTVQPDAPLAAGTYTLAVEPAVADTSGNRLGAAAQVSFATFSAMADLYPPSAPGLQYARPSGLSSVELTWTASVDDGGPIKEYRVYRNLTPLIAADLISANLVAVVNGAATSVTTATASGETARSYAYYYCVAAVDSADRLSVPSVNVAPNPHGMFGTASRRNVRSCTRCHNIHGGMEVAPALSANSAEQCYLCHGATPGNNAWGYASTMDSQGDFNDDSGVATGGVDGIGNGGWTIHRTGALYAGGGATVNYQCMACHTAHRKAYDDTLPGSSYGRLLRKYPSGLTGASTYSTDAAPFKEDLCYQCHGATSLTFMEALSPGAYSNTGGDHETVYKTTGASGAAHNPTIVMKNRTRPRLNTGSLPIIACLACHNEHASPNRGMTDYRQSNTTATTFSQAGLCFECHTKGTGADGQTEVISSGTVTTGFTWNSRDVKAEFQRTSRHPTTVGGGRWAPKSGTVFSQTLEADFQSDALFQTSTTLELDSVVLGQYTTTITPPKRPLVYAQRGGVGITTFSSYDSGGTTWNTTPRDNTQFSPATGASAFFLNGKFYTTRGGGSYASQAVYDPVADTWAAGTALSENIGVGGGSAVNSRAADTCVYYTAAGGANTRIMWWDYTNTSTGEFNFQTAGIDRTLGIGSDIAFAPDANRLFVIYKNGTGGDGRIYYRSAPGRTITDEDFTQGPLTVSDSFTSRYNRMRYFKKNGTEYLFIIGRNTGDTSAGMVISNLAGAPVVTGKGDPFGGTSTADGCDLVWDGGDYLYAFNGTTLFRRAQIPSDPVGGTWTWENLTSPFTQDPGSAMAIDPAWQPPDTSGPAYYSSGTVTTPDITMPGRPIAWGTLTWTESEPANTAFSVTVQGWNGSTWVDLVTDATSPTDLSSYSVTTYTKLRLVGNFTTTDNQATPRLDDWTVTASRDEWESGSYVQQPSTVFAQTLQAEFGSDTRFQTVTTVLDLVELDKYAKSIPANPYVLVSQAASSGGTDSYLDGDAAWNEDFDPTSIGTSPGSGANSATKNGVVFAMQGSSTTMRTFTPPANSGTGTWGTTTNVWQTANIGSDMAFDTAHNYIWALVGGYTPVSYGSGGTNIRRTTNFSGTSLAWYDTTSYDGPAFLVGGTPTRLGAGATLSWVPANDARPERLYVVNRDGTTSRNGLLYYYSSPDGATGGSNWTSTTHVLGRTSTTPDTGSRSVYFRIGTTDYIYYLRGGDNVEYLIQLLNTTEAAGTVLDNGTANPWGDNVGDGCSIIWNGDSTQAGFRLYATRGGGTDLTFKVATWNGSALVWSAGPALANNSTVGTYLSYVSCDPADPTPYYTSGTVTTGDNAILPDADAANWGTVTWTESEPAAATKFKVTVQGWNGSWVDLVTDADSSGVDLSAYSTTTYTKLRLVGTLTTSDQSQTPDLDDWAVTALHDTFVQQGSVTCANCHNAHEVKLASGVWSLSRVSDPSNTHNAATGDFGTFCLKCHGATPPSVAKRTTSELVPYAVSFTAMPSSSYPFFAGWDKSVTNVDWTGSRHNAVAAVASKCGTCHDPHGSDFPRLTALTQGSYSRANTNITASSEQNLCYGGSADNSCHYYTSGTLLSYQVAGTGAPFNVATYKHPVATTGRHTDTETATGLGTANRHAECVDCHDPHAARAGVHTQKQSAAAPALRGATGVKPSSWPALWTAPAAGDYATTRMTGQSTDYEAYVCFKCHSGYTTRPNSPSGGFAETDVALEFNPNNASGHNVLGDVFTKDVTNESYTWSKAPSLNFGTTGWTVDSEMTCSDCHSYNATGARGPHGSAVPFILKFGNATRWYTTLIGSWSNAANMCNQCHTTNSHASWYGEDSDHNRQCGHCHVTIPHGWKRPRLLINVSDYTGANAGSPYVYTGNGNIYGFQLKSYTDGPSSNEDDCGDSCDTGRHPNDGPWW